MIWIFDSGVWGLNTLNLYKKYLPQHNYIFLADNKNFPFGEKKDKEIIDITFNWLNRLFDNWAKIVVVACNTAAAYSVRKWQELYPEKKVLSVTIPAVEEILNITTKEDKIWVIATQATIRSWIFNDLFNRFWGQYNPNFEFIIEKNLIELAESWIQNQQEIFKVIKQTISQFHSKIKYLILWCTHYSLYYSQFKDFFNWKIIDPSFLSMVKFQEYLEKHIEIDQTITKTWKVELYCTWEYNKKLNQEDYVFPLNFTKITL